MLRPCSRPAAKGAVSSGETYGSAMAKNCCAIEYTAELLEVRRGTICIWIKRYVSDRFRQEHLGRKRRATRTTRNAPASPR